MPCWTNHELRRLKEVYRSADVPSGGQLALEFPRHTLDSVRATAAAAGVRWPQDSRRHLFWLTLAHQHFARREAEMRVWD